MKDSRIVGLPRSTQCFFDKSGTRPRAAVIAPRNMKLWFVSELSTPDLAICLWRNGPEEIYIVSGYFDILDNDVIPRSLTRLMTKSSKEKIPVALFLDTNAHSSLWGEENNARGDRMEEWLFAHPLSVLNRGSHFTFHNRRAETIIDVTLCSQSIDI